MKTQLTLAALLAAVVAHDVYLLSTGAEVEVVADVPAEAVELKTADATVLKAEIANAETTKIVKCELATLRFGADGPEREECYCTDGERAGWVTDATKCQGEVMVSGDEVYVKEIVRVIEGVKAVVE